MAENLVAEHYEIDFDQIFHIKEALDIDRVG